jgi:hypothetical protein
VTQPVKTVICSYGATGEGHTIFIWIGYAATPEAALTEFGRKFDPYFAQGADVYDGLRLDLPGFEMLVGKEMGEQLTAMFAQGKANVCFSSEYHYNYS